MRRVVVVGASLAGVRTAEALRRRGFSGELTIVGAEPHYPYDRPPLSKQLLAGAIEAEACLLRRRGNVRARWLLGRPAVALDPVESRLRLSDGAVLEFDGLVIATGCGARAWPGEVPASGVHVLRGLDDALALRRAVRHDRGVAIVGAGFIGCEVAATLRAQGAEVTLVDIAPRPMMPLGPLVGEVCARLHEQRGVRLRLASQVVGLEGRRKLQAVRLENGECVNADIAVIALGAVPHLGWLRGAGLALADGVVVDEHCFADRARRIVAVGDAAVSPHPLADGEPTAVRHWANAVEQAAIAAANLLAPEAAHLCPYIAVPSFWSDQYDVKIQSVGLPELADSFELIKGSIEELRFVLLARRGQRLVGAIGFNSGRALAEIRRDLTDRLRAAQSLMPGARPQARSISAM